MNFVLPMIGEGQTYSQCLAVTETLPDGTKTTVDLKNLGTAPFQPKTDLNPCD